MQILVARDGEQFGPYTAEEVRDYLAEGVMFLSDLAWHDGLDEWVTLDQVELDCPPEKMPPPPPKFARKPGNSLSPLTGLGTPEGTLFDASLLNGFIIIPANLQGDLTRDIAAELLDRQLVTPRITQVGFAADGVARALADGLVVEAQDFELFGAYDFVFDRIGFLHRLAMSNEQIHKADDDKSGQMSTPYFDITTPLPERVDKVTGITAGPLGSRILLVEYTTAIAFPPDMHTIAPYLYTGRSAKASFQRYDDGWRLIGDL